MAKTRTELIRELVENTDVDFGTDESSYVSVSSDDLIKYVPMEYPVNGDDCRFVLSTDTIEGQSCFIVSYERLEDNYVCMTITGETLFDVLYNTILETCAD